MNKLDKQLILASKQGNLPIIEDLILRGASLVNTGHIAIKVAFESKQMNVVRFFIKYGFSLSI